MRAPSSLSRVLAQRSDPIPEAVSEFLSADVVAACTAVRDARQGERGTGGDQGPDVDAAIGTPGAAPAAAPPPRDEQDYGLDELALA